MKAEESQAARLQLAREKRMHMIQVRKARMVSRFSQDKKERISNKKAIRLRNAEVEDRRVSETQKQDRIELAKNVAQFKHAQEAAKQLRDERVNLRAIMKAQAAMRPKNGEIRVPTAVHR